MKTIIKKLGIAIQIIAFLTFVNPVKADINPANMAGTTIAGAGALSVFMGIAAGAAIAVTGGLAIGALGVAILIKNGSGAPANRTDAPIVINLNPKVPLIVPSGWTAPTPPATQPVPPSSSAFNSNAGATNYNSPAAYYTQLNNNASYGNTMALACTNSVGMPTGVAGATNILTAVHNGATTCNITFNNSGGFTQNVPLSTNANSCPAGYVVSGADPSKTCTLSSPSSVIKPIKGKIEIIRTGNTLAVDPQANPTDKLAAPVFVSTSNSISMTGSDGSTTKVQIETDGTSSVTVNTPSSEAGQSIQSKTTFSAPDPSTGDVTVTGNSEQAVYGTGQATGTTPVAGGGTGTEIDFPDDYNREATQQEIRDDTEEIKDGITNAENHSVELDGAATDYDEKATAHQAQYESIGAGGLDTHGVDTDFEKPMLGTASCSSMSMPVNGGTSSIDFCDKTNAARDIIGWIFYALTAWGIFGVLTGRRDT